MKEKRKTNSSTKNEEKKKDRKTLLRNNKLDLGFVQPLFYVSAYGCNSGRQLS